MSKHGLNSSSGSAIDASRITESTVSATPQANKKARKVGPSTISPARRFANEVRAKVFVIGDLEVGLGLQHFFWTSVFLYLYYIPSLFTGTVDAEIRNSNTTKLIFMSPS